MPTGKKIYLIRDTYDHEYTHMYCDWARDQKQYIGTLFIDLVKSMFGTETVTLLLETGSIKLQLQVTDLDDY